MLDQATLRLVCIVPNSTHNQVSQQEHIRVSIIILKNTHYRDFIKELTNVTSDGKKATALLNLHWYFDGTDNVSMI